MIRYASVCSGIKARVNSALWPNAMGYVGYKKCGIIKEIIMSEPSVFVAGSQAEMMAELHEMAMSKNPRLAEIGKLMKQVHPLVLDWVHKLEREDMPIEEIILLSVDALIFSMLSIGATVMKTNDINAQVELARMLSGVSKLSWDKAIRIMAEESDKASES